MPEIGHTTQLSSPNQHFSGVEAMKTTYAGILCVLLLLVSACAQKVNDPADVQAIRTSVEDFAKSLNAGDADGVAAVMTDKTIFADANIPVLVGKEAVRSLYQNVFSRFRADSSAPVEDVRVVGDIAVARGTWTVKQTPKAEGVASIVDSGTWVTVFARQNDGSWKWDWCVPNSNQPAPGSTASGEDEQALYQLERDWAEALLKANADSLGQILGTDFIGNSEGQVTTRAQLLASLRSGAFKVESMTLSDMRAMVLGDRAIVQGISTFKGSEKGKDASGRNSWTDVYAKRDGRWQCVTAYMTNLQ